LSTLQSVIESAWERRTELGPTRAELELREAVEETLAGLDSGKLRVAEQRDGRWVVNQWVKQAVLLSFRINDNRVVDAGFTRFFDKVPSKFAQYDAEQFRRGGMRVVPDAVVRRGAYIAADVVLMPSFVNIGAYVDRGTMVDTWVTVGSCAQIGKRVHLSGGVGIGGVLEPLQAAPTIVEDDCFIGARSEVVEGVVVERGSVLGMGVYIGQSTRVYEGRQVLAVLRRDLQEGRREDALEDVVERAAANRRLSDSAVDL
jgi:2,3,4,5-tetrahydropyridine-2-carboxylate N-succinyltransferase